MRAASLALKPIDTQTCCIVIVMTTKYTVCYFSLEVFLMKNTNFVEEILLEIEFQNFYNILYPLEVYCVCYFNDFSVEKLFNDAQWTQKYFPKKLLVFHQHKSTYLTHYFQYSSHFGATMKTKLPNTNFTSKPFSKRELDAVHSNLASSLPSGNILFFRTVIACSNYLCHVVFIMHQSVFGSFNPNVLCLPTMNLHLHPNKQ